MHTRLLISAFIVLLAILVAPMPLSATDGYFQLGYGTQSKGMGGAGVAFHFGPMSPATNPAAIVLGPGGFDLNIAAFNPNRQYEVVGNPTGYPGTFGLFPAR